MPMVVVGGLRRLGWVRRLRWLGRLRWLRGLRRSRPTAQGLFEIQLCECECVRLSRIVTELRAGLYPHEPGERGVAIIASGLFQQRQHVEPDRRRGQTHSAVREVKDRLAPGVFIET